MSLACLDVRVIVADRALVDGVSFEVESGSWLNVVGPNGAGKTTLLRAIAGLTTSSGEIVLDGLSATALSRRERSRAVAMVPQVPLVPQGMTVVDYVLLGRTPHLHPLANESEADLEVVRDALVRLDLLGFADRPVETLSGGERQRVLVARLLAQDTPIALLDEPTTALDVGHQQHVLDLVDELRRERRLTVVATLHDLTLASQYGDRVALLVDGQIVADGTATDVLTEDRIARHYGARVRVVAGAVIPVREEPT